MKLINSRPSFYIVVDRKKAGKKYDKDVHVILSYLGENLETGFCRTRRVGGQHAATIIDVYLISDLSDDDVSNAFLLAKDAAVGTEGIALKY